MSVRTTLTGVRAPAMLNPPPRDQIRVHRCCYRGQARVDVRWWTQDDVGGWRPTRKGMSLPLADWVALLPLIGQKLAQEGPD